MYQHFIPSYGWTMSCWMCGPHFVHLFICWWLLGLLPPFGDGEECCCGYGVSVFVPAVASLGVSPGVELLGRMVISVCNFMRNCSTASQLHHFTFPPATCTWVPIFPYPRQYLLFFIFLDNSHPNGCVRNFWPSTLMNVGWLRSAAHHCEEPVPSSYYKGAVA